MWADVLQEEETPAMGGMSALLSPPSGRGMVKTHLDKFAHTKKKGTLVYVSVPTVAKDRGVCLYKDPK